MPVENRKSVEGYKEYAKKLNAVGAEVKKAGKKLLYHPHALEFASFGDGRIGLDILIHRDRSGSS